MRTTKEAIISEYFATAPMEAAEAMLKVAKAAVGARKKKQEADDEAF